RAQGGRTACRHSIEIDTRASRYRTVGASVFWVYCASAGRIPGDCREVYGSKLHISVLPKSDKPCNVTCNLIASVASWIYQWPRPALSTSLLKTGTSLCTAY